MGFLGRWGGKVLQMVTDHREMAETGAAAKKASAAEVKMRMMGF